MALRDKIKINKGQQLYVVPCGQSGFTCLGFEYAERRRKAVAEWLGVECPEMRTGTLKHYAAYRQMMAAGQERARVTNTKCPANLTPELVGLEGRLVEVFRPDEGRVRFQVGRSTGWMPCHIELANRNSHSGGAVYWPEGARLERIIR